MDRRLVDAIKRKKCQVNLFGFSNPKFDYYMKGSETPDLSWKDHILGIIATSNIILGSLKKAFVNRDSHIKKNVYISPVISHLEYAFQVL